ncbi:hypothetical protein Tco_0091040 [Tanacetum coccineum]
MERAATTASSLEAEQDNGNINRTQSMETLNESFPQGTDSGSGPKCQDTILEAQKLKFDLRLHLHKSYDPHLSRVNTLGSGEDSMKLKELMEFCTKLSVRFWTTAKAKTVNGERQIQALVDKNKVIITEKSVTSNLMLEDAKGTECLPNDGRKSFLLGRITPLFQTMMVQAPEDMGEDSAAPTDSHSTPIITQPSSSKPQKKKSRRKQRKDSGPTEPIPDEATNEEPISTPSCDPPQSGKDRLQLTELMSLCTKLQKQVLDLEEAKTAQAKEIASLKKRVKQLEKRRKSRTSGLKRLRKVGSASRVESSNDVSLGAQEDASKQGRKIADLDDDAEVTLIDETQGRNDEDLMFDTDVLNGDEVFEEPIVNAAKTTSSIPVSVVDLVTTVGEVVTTASATTTVDESARNLEAQLQAELEEEERLARQKEEEATIALCKSWDNTQTMIEADRLLAERLQTREQEESTDEEKARLFVKLLEKRKKIVAALRAQEKRSKPPNKTQKRNTMSTYLKNMDGYKHNQLKRKSYNEIQEMFDKEMKMVNTFVRKQEKAKKKKGDKEEEEMKKHVEIVQDDEVAIDAIPLATKPPMIVEYKIDKEGNYGNYL